MCPAEGKPHRKYIGKAWKNEHRAVKVHSNTRKPSSKGQNAKWPNTIESEMNKICRHKSFYQIVKDRYYL